MRTRIVFTGHRDAECDDNSLDLIVAEYPNALWIHGNNKHGFDACMERYAIAHNIPVLHFDPDYTRYGSKQAPLKRNEQMLKIADVLVALYDERKEGGTYYTVKKAEKLHIPIIRVTRK